MEPQVVLSCHCKEGNSGSCSLIVNLLIATEPKAKDMILSYTITITPCSVDSDAKGQNILGTLIHQLTDSAQKKWDCFQDKFIMKLITQFSLSGKTGKPSLSWYFLLGRGDRPRMKVKEVDIFKMFL